MEENTENKNKDVIDNTDQNGTEENGTSGNATNNNSDSGSTNTEKSFTQKQVSSMMAKEKKQGREAAYREMGIDPNDTAMVKMFKAFIDSQKSDEQKSIEEAAEQANKIAEAEHRAIVAEAKAEAMQLGILPQYVEDAVTLALSKATDDNDIKTVIGEFKTKYSIWFNNAGSDNNSGNGGNSSTGQKGTGASVNNNSSENGKDNKGLGARLAAQRKGVNGNNKKSFWS